MEAQKLKSREWVASFVQAHENFAQASTAKYFDYALEGWAYTHIFESRYIIPSLSPIPEGAKKKPGMPPLEETNLEPHQYFAQLEQAQDTKERWALLQSLVNTPSKTILEDSFADTKAEDLDQSLRQSVSGEGLNIVILGAGCVGLAFANMLKNIMGQDVNILIIENRIYQKHYKQPYTRNWLTHIGQQYMDFFAPDMRRLFDLVQTESSIGLPINMLETLSLLSCKAMGVSFYFDQSYDLSFIEQSGADLIFDCTGARLNPEAGIPSSAPDLKRNANEDIVIEATTPPDLHAKYARFGLSRNSDTSKLTFHLREEQGAFYPHVDDQKIQTAVVKILHIPADHHSDLLDQTKPENEDNKFFIWPGHLDAAINELIVHVNVDEDGYKTLSNMIDTPLSIKAFLARDLSALEKHDPGLLAFLKNLEQKDINLDDVYIERPFLYTPYVYPLSGTLQRFYGRAVIPLGDSVYNGNPKAGNGLGYHMAYLSNMYQGMKRLYHQVRPL